MSLALVLHLREPLRVCLDCGLEAHNLKDLELFNRKKGSKYDRQNLCKACGNERNRKWHKANPEKSKEYNRKHYEANRKKRNEQNKNYRKANPEKKRKQDRIYYKANREKLLKNQKKYHDTHPEKIKEYNRKYWKENPFRAMVIRVKKRSKKRELDFDLDLEYMKQLWAECDGICPMTGVTMLRNSEGYDRDPVVMSVDRIVPEKGYVKGNVRLVSLWYNRARSNYGDNFMLEMCQRVVECARLLLKKEVPR